MSSYYKRAHAVIIVFDYTDEHSFDRIKYWLNKIEENANQKVFTVIFGNKVDKPDVAVTQQDINDCKAISGMPLFETSACTGH